MQSDQLPDEFDDLGGRTLRGAAWSYGSMAAGLVVQVVYTSVMSRLLEPGDFGVVAAAIVGTQLISLLGRMGVTSAVTQRTSVTHHELRVAHGLSMLVGLSAFAVAAALSGVLSALVRSPQSGPVMVAMGAGFFVSAVGAVPEASLRRAFRFRELAVWQVLTSLVACSIGGVLPALLGVGYWSIVSANLAQLLLYSVAMIRLTRLIAPRWDVPIAKAFLHFGGKVTAISLLEYGSKTADNISVSRWMGQTQLGFYSRGQVLVGLVSENAFTSANRVLQPALSRVKEDRRRFGRAYTRAAGLLSLTVFVPVVMITVAAPVVVRVVLGPGWEPTTRVLPILAFGYSVGAWCNFHGVAAEAAGMLNRKMIVQAINLAVAVTAMALVVHRGPSLAGFALAWSLAECARAALYIGFILPSIGVPIRQLLGRTIASLGFAAATASPVFVLVRVVGSMSVLGVIAAGFAGVGVGALLLASMPHSWISVEVRHLRLAIHER